MKGKEFDFVDCCIKLSEKDDFETELRNLCADKNATLEQVFDCVKNRLEKVKGFYGIKCITKVSARWYLKQLFPLTYRTKYRKEGKMVFAFGICGLESATMLRNTKSKNNLTR